MTDKELAEQIVDLVGGKGNISSVAHCATRLRIVVNDKDKINNDAIDDLDKTKGSFFNSGQYQIILGTGLVNRVYDETVKITGESSSSSGEEKQVYGNAFQRAIRMFSDVFVPIIPVLVATGLFMGVRGLLTQEAVLGVFGLTPADVPEAFLTFTTILTDTAFAFLPALVCWSTFKNFGGNPVIGIVLGLMLVSPSLPSAYDVGSGDAQPLMFFNFIQVSGYQGSVLPAFITGICGAYFERWLRTWVPDALDLIITPFLTLLLGLVVALFILGPILHGLENVILVVVRSLLFLPFGIGGLLYGSFGQLLGIFGIHHILNFLEISMLANDGWNYLNPIGTCGNVAQAGAVLAVALKARSNKTKQIAYPASLSALLGITEPAVFGVNLVYIKPYVMAMIGGGVGGFLASIFHLRATGMAITGIPGTLLYLNEQLPLYILVNVVSFGVALVLTYLFGFNAKMEGTDGGVANPNEVGEQALEMYENPKEHPIAKLIAPLSGKTLELAKVADPVFSSKALGDGLAIEPTDEVLLAPADGEVTVLMDGSNHAVGLKLDNGAELLLHIGIDTVNMEGKGFTPHVKVGDRVKTGDQLITFSADEIKKAGHPLTTMVILTDPNGIDYELLEGKDVIAGDDEIIRFQKVQ